MIAFASARVTGAQPADEPEVGGVSPRTTGPAAVTAPTCTCAIVAGAMLLTLSSKHSSPCPTFTVITAVPVPSASPGPGISAAPVSVAVRRRPPWSASAILASCGPPTVGAVRGAGSAQAVARAAAATRANERRMGFLCVIQV
jgi:hypothetical protein